MNCELFFIYDSHCPWSYATLPLVNEIAQKLPEITINLFHCARYDGETGITTDTLDAVTTASDIHFAAAYRQHAQTAKDSTLIANLMTWVSSKVPAKALAVLNQIAQAHFTDGNPLTAPEAIAEIIAEYKLSPPAKVLKNDKLSKATEGSLYELEELQEFIGTSAIPALLLAIDDQLILLNHNLYLLKPSAIIDAIKLEQAR